MMVANRLDASEGLSRDFEYRVEVLSDDARLQLKHVQGRMVTIELVREDGSLRHFNGYVFEFALMHTDGGLAHYEMVLRPWLAYLRLRHDNYLFHDKTLLDVMTDDPVWYGWSVGQMNGLAINNELAINDIIYSELAPSFSRFEELSLTVEDMGLRLRPMPRAALFLAGKVNDKPRHHSKVANLLITRWYGKDNPQLQRLAAGAPTVDPATVRNMPPAQLAEARAFWENM